MLSVFDFLKSYLFNLPCIYSDNGIYFGAFLKGLFCLIVLMVCYTIASIRVDHFSVALSLLFEVSQKTQMGKNEMTPERSCQTKRAVHEKHEN